MCGAHFIHVSSSCAHVVCWLILYDSFLLFAFHLPFHSHDHRLPCGRQEPCALLRMRTVASWPRTVFSQVPHVRVQQRTTEQFEDAPQSPAGVVEEVTFVPREQAHQRTAWKIGEVPDGKPRLAFAAYSGVVPWKIALQERIYEEMRDKISRECLLCGFQLWRYW